MIEVKNLVTVHGKGGVYKLVSVRPNGLIIEDLDTKKREFAPVRQHEFSAFEVISIFTDGENTVALAEVLSLMKKQAEEGNEPPAEKSPSDELRDYFISILPTHDRDRVHISDIKKIIKWYNFLSKRNLLIEKVEEKAAEEKIEEKAEATVETTEG